MFQWSASATVMVAAKRIPVNHHHKQFMQLVITRFTETLLENTDCMRLYSWTNGTCSLVHTSSCCCLSSMTAWSLRVPPYSHRTLLITLHHQHPNQHSLKQLMAQLGDKLHRFLDFRVQPADNTNVNISKHTYRLTVRVLLQLWSRKPLSDKDDAIPCVARQQGYFLGLPFTLH